MKGDPQFVILKHQAWLESADFEDKMLGAIIKEPLSPSTNFVPESPGVYMDREPQKGTVTDFVLQNDGDAAQGLAASTHSIGGYAVAGSRHDAVQLGGKLIRIRRIQQLDRFWARLKDDAQVRDTVPRWVSFFSPWPVCLVVGVMICEDVEVSFGGEQSRAHEGRVELPIGRVALAMSGVPVPPAIGEPGAVAAAQAKASCSQESATLFKARSGQSKIFALELRRVTTELFRRKLLLLKNDGPDFDDVRLASDEPLDENQDLEGPVLPENLILDKMDPEVYDDMIQT